MLVQCPQFYIGLQTSNSEADQLRGCIEAGESPPLDATDRAPFTHGFGQSRAQWVHAATGGDESKRKAGEKFQAAWREKFRGGIPDEEDSVPFETYQVSVDRCCSGVRASLPPYRLGSGARVDHLHLDTAVGVAAQAFAVEGSTLAPTLPGFSSRHTYASLPSQTDDKQIFCRIRAPLELLEVQADATNYRLQFNGAIDPVCGPSICTPFSFCSKPSVTAAVPGL